MQSPQSSLNPWLMSYIEQHQASQTRYQIDKYLIEAGYNPAEIELVWQTINKKGYNSDKDKSKRNLTPYLMEAKNPQLWIILVIGIAVLAVLGADAGLFGPIGGSPRLDNITCPSETTCYAVGDLILATHDGGQTWQKQSFSGIRRVLNASCLSPENCFAVSWSGSILSTINRGKSWTYYSAGATQHLDSISCAGSNTCFIGGSDSDDKGVSKGGIILATNNGGQTWEKRWSSPNNYVAEISCPDPTTCFAAGYDSAILTTDGGNTWNVQQLGSSMINDFQHISCPNVNTCYAVAELDGGIVATTNRGQVWQAQPYKSPIQLQSQSGASSDGYRIKHISCPDPTTCFAVGYRELANSSWTGETTVYNGSGGILITTDGGKNWTAKSSNEIKNLDSISCPTINSCFGLDSSRGYIVSTRDGGQTWAILYPNPNNPKDK